MIRITARPASFLGALALCFTLLPTAGAQRGGVRKFAPKGKKPSAAQTKNPPLPTYQPAPLTPVPLDQVPAVAPVVKFKDGELTIEAHNSTLSDVLKAVRQETGAELEIPPNATERVVADIGPGPARQVLAELLNGTHFNYVMVGSSTDPSAVQSIFLTSKSTSGPGESAAAGPGRPRMAEPTPVATVPEPDSQDGDDAEAADEQPATEQTADQQNQGQPPPKTPEQLLQELQRQQQQAQQNGQPGQTPPGQSQPSILPNQPPTTVPPNAHRPE